MIHLKVNTEENVTSGGDVYLLDGGIIALNDVFP